jgi:outer membrane protein assembly factor BamD
MRQYAVFVPKTFFRPLVAIFAVTVLLASAGCGSTSENSKEAEYVDRPVEELYNAAVDAALDGNFRSAAPLFDEVERQHPYSVWATQGQLMAAYALYQSNQYDEALNALDRFIQLNPSHANVDYAYYLKGLAFYEQIVDVGRDQKLTRDALDTFNEVIKRFPRSKFARDARLKIDLAQNHLAGKEMEIGRFYLTRGQYLAAINRFRSVVHYFDTTEQVPEALHRLTEAYLALGLSEEAAKTTAVLGHNYPGSQWYQDSYVLMTTGQPYRAGKDENGLLGLGLWIF